MRTLPDVASDTSAETPLTLNWVGMDNIAVPITMKTTHGSVDRLVATSNIYVSLDKSDAKGIHMSRLHALVNKLAAIECDKKNIEQSLNEMVSSQQGISECAKITLAFELMLKKPALLSNEVGYQSYPVVIDAEKTNDGFNFTFEITIPYSSTCPCSASLARQLYAEAIDSKFSGQQIDKAQLLEWIQSSAGSIATPHSQRSYAYLRLTLNDEHWPDISELIFALESIIATPVQTAVKRIDEQEFARLNATNLMFCEDTARKLKSTLDQMSFVKDFWCKVEHQESLHAHNAVAIASK